MYPRLQQVRAQGSGLYSGKPGAIGAGAIFRGDIWSFFAGQAAINAWDYLDSTTVINNSAQTIEFASAPEETYIILPYQIQPITRKPVRTFTVKNTGGLATLADDIIIQMRRLSPDVQTVISTKGG